IRHDLIRYFEEGIDWLIFMGNLGFEYWALQVAKELQEEYKFSIATIFTFENHGQNWNEANQVKLDEFKQVDFVKYTYKSYENPSQFKNYNQFLVDNTEGAYLFYDTENETTLKYLLQVMQEKEDYPINFLTFDRLNEFLEEW
ncbi:MAG: SLOG family protein, partial [Streptococcus gallolyticus]|nr:SLOG family protein [Streptococcus gallolyticus]